MSNKRYILQWTDNDGRVLYNERDNCWVHYMRESRLYTKDELLQLITRLTLRTNFSMELAVFETQEPVQIELNEEFFLSDD